MEHKKQNYNATSEKQHRALLEIILEISKEFRIKEFLELIQKHEENSEALGALPKPCENEFYINLYSNLIK